MRNTARIAAIATLFVTVAGITWLVLESTPVRLGFEDTDDPALMVDFVRQYPHVFAQAGVVLIMMAIGLTIAVLAVTDVIRPAAGALSIRATGAFGLFSAGLLLLGGGIRVGSSGPLLHMADLSQATGEAAYVAAQVVSQAVLNAGLLALSLWSVGLSVIGFRSKVLPLVLCALGVLPGYRIVGGVLGPVGLLPEIDVLWLISIASIFG
ncbi:MAG: hypothetical protein ACT4OQ_00205, partial [Chloroflexota bacterium]